MVCTHRDCRTGTWTRAFQNTSREKKPLVLDIISVLWDCSSPTHLSCCCLRLSQMGRLVLDIFWGYPGIFLCLGKREDHFYVLKVSSLRPSSTDFIKMVHIEIAFVSYIFKDFKLFLIVIWLFFLSILAIGRQWWGLGSMMLTGDMFDHAGCAVSLKGVPAFAGVDGSSGNWSRPPFLDLSPVLLRSHGTGAESSSPIQCRSPSLFISSANLIFCTRAEESYVFIQLNCRC